MSSREKILSQIKINQPNFQELNVNFKFDTIYESLYEKFGVLIEKIANINPISFTETEVAKTVGQLIQTDKLFIETGIEIDADNEKKKITVSRTLKEIEEMLEEYNFLRVHHSYLINLNEI